MILILLNDRTAKSLCLPPIAPQLSGQITYVSRFSLNLFLFFTTFSNPRVLFKAPLSVSEIKFGQIKIQFFLVKLKFSFFLIFEKNFFH